MKTYNNLNLNQKHRSGVVAIGNFDGIHLGHQKVINDAKKMAKKNRLPFGLMTFEPVPVMFFNKKITNHRLDTLSQKISNLKKEKLDFIIIQKFNKSFSKLNYRNFIYKILYKKIKCNYLYVSKKFRFGKKREVDVFKLKRYEKK